MNQSILKRLFTPAGGVFLFLVCGAIRLVFHEPWRDEAGVWLNAIYNPSLRELFQSIQYSGHPYLFDAAAWFLARFSPSFLALQLFALVISTCSAYLLLSYSPFSVFEKWLLCFSYFLAFEYSVIGRPYVLVPLFGFLFCSIRRRSPSALASQVLALAALMQTSVYGAILGLAFGVPVILWQSGAEVSRRKRAACAVLLLGSLAAAAWQMYPPVPDGFAPGYFTRLDLSRFLRVLGGIWRGIVPFPQLGLHFWNSNFLDQYPVIMALAGVGCFFSGLLFLRPCGRISLTGFVLLVFGQLAFCYFKYPGNLRHHGHYFVGLIMALWIGGRSAVPTARASLRQAAFPALCLLHVGVWMYASFMDFRYPFSSAREAAGFAKEAKADGCLLAGERPPPAATVALELRKAFYYPSIERFGTYVIWDNSYPVLLDSELVNRIERKRAGRCAVLVMNRPLQIESSFKFVGSTVSPIKEDERFFVYRVD